MTNVLIRVRREGRETHKGEDHGKGEPLIGVMQPQPYLQIW